MNYTVVLTYDEDRYLVTVPALPGCLTEGMTVEEALAMAEDAIKLYIEDKRAHGEPVPIEGRSPVVTTVPGA